VLWTFEDIGRHNAVDKVFGRCFLEEVPTADKLMVFSGRVSSEILIKIARLGISILIARGAPTDLALEMAKELGVTVVGFARGDKLNIYTHGYRIKV
jgi:FdhD protein